MPLCYPDRPDMPLRDDVAERAQARVGVTLNGKWRLDKVLGIGGMAAVYAATHRNQSRVAIKMLHPEVSIDREVTSRFLREGYVANTVGHPGTVTVFDDDVTADGAAFLVMELLDGETLDARWVRGGCALPMREVLAFVDRLLDVLVSAHAKDIVHRDLKPENLFLTRDGQLKVLDFGIARLRELSAGTPGTRAGSLLGTPAFMAPEQARGRWDDVDGRTDLWAVGATAVTLLSGRYVHEAGTANEQLILAATVPAPSLGTLMTELPKAVVELFDRALAFDKTLRWPDARAMKLALRDARETALSEASPLSLPRAVGYLEQHPTLVAPSEISEISGVSDIVKTEAQNSTPALSGTLAGTLSQSQPPKSRRGLVAAVAGAVALGVVAVVALVDRSNAPPVDPSAGSVQAAHPGAPERERLQPPVAAKAAATAPVPTLVPVPAEPAAPATEAGKKARPVKGVPSAPHPVGKLPVPVTATAPPTPPTPPTPTVNPFDLRH